MRAHPEHETELPTFYERKRNAFLEAVGSLPFTMTPSRGTYFQLADYSQCALLAELDDVACAQKLTKDYGVAVIPISVFYDAPPEDQRLIRFCFAKSEPVLREAADRLTALSAASG